MGLLTRVNEFRNPMEKKFKSEVPLNGMVEYRISPFETKLFGDWRDPKIMARRFRTNVTAHLWYGAPFIALFFGVKWWAVWQHEQYEKEHRY